MTTTTTVVRVEAVPWTHADATALREQMTAELRPRYADAVRTRGPFPESDPATVVVTLVAYAGTDPVGTAALRLVDGLHEVKRVYVAPSHRRTGLAARLLAELEAHARAREVRTLVLQTGVRQPEAVALYTREGWQPVPPFGQYVGDPYSLCFAKDLA
ncbi:N-acetyltransferase [Cellulomonas chitinilytica]|uniref:N-acetyltransferase n=1 Tax=Cellulomonas chitinilytica TaxID=398759 RepID=A0A919P253_9CELL|nr:GNAT family N-acetyltransferase [Cellulomonas chitinilytica]GIG20074.1 N-acetyltransferase [Cellulomonas chitinilytica]